MPLDFDTLKAASTDDLVVIALCEFSRFVDAIERMAPTAPDLQAAALEAAMAPAAPVCPHPAELRKNLASMGHEPFSIFQCGVCQETVTRQPVEA